MNFGTHYLVFKDPSKPKYFTDFLSFCQAPIFIFLQALNLRTVQVILKFYEIACPLSTSAVFPPKVSLKGAAL
jgi:hypothetical protein